jgi:hypothetical protein
MYNLPPWIATKWFLMLLALLISGKEQVRSEKHLRPLIDELQELWQPNI